MKSESERSGSFKRGAKSSIKVVLNAGWKGKRITFGEMSSREGHERAVQK